MQRHGQATSSFNRDSPYTPTPIPPPSTSVYVTGPIGWTRWSKAADSITTRAIVVARPDSGAPGVAGARHASLLARLETVITGSYRLPVAQLDDNAE